MLTNKATRGIVCAALGGIFWGFSGACGQFLFNWYSVDPLWISAVRMMGAAPILMLLCLARSSWRSSLVDIWKKPKDVLQLILSTIFGMCFVQIAYLVAISYSNAATATVLQYAGPVMVVLVVCLLGKRAPTVKEVLAMVSVVLGVFILATHGNPGNLALSPEGIIWGLLAAVGVVFYTLLPSSLMWRFGSMPVLAWCMTLSAIVTVSAVQPWNAMPDLDAVGWVAVGAMIVVGTVGGFAFYLQGVNDAGASKASLVSSVETVSATAFAVLWLGTSFMPMDFVGFIFIMITVFLLHHREEPAQVESSQL